MSRVLKETVRRLLSVARPEGGWQRGARSVLFVRSTASTLPAAKVAAFARMVLEAARGPQGRLLPGIVGSSDRQVSAWTDECSLQRARCLRAARALLVTINDFSSEPERPVPPDLVNLRARSMLCVESRILDCRTGGLVARRAFALCRRTSPIVPGTSVGGSSIDRLLDEMAVAVANYWEVAR